MKTQLLAGELPFPSDKILTKYKDRKSEILRFWNTIWYNYLNGSETNGIRWYEKLGYKTYNDVVRRLSHNKWITSNSLSGRRWLSIEMNSDKLLEFITEDQLENVKAKYKYAKYLLGFDVSDKSDVVKQNGKFKQTGLVREGMMLTGNTQFGYDTEALKEYEREVKLNLTKSMDKIRKIYPEMKSSKSSYDEVSVGVFDYHINNQKRVFTMGNNVSDSRGRAISDCLGKVANPIGFKDFRAALVITYDDDNYDYDKYH